jgi:glycosyltransferase involved in cell wall biosynthesis
VQHADVEVLTTCASSDTTWANEFAAGSETSNGVQIRRFRVSPPSGAATLARFSDRVFTQTHSLGDELRWLDAAAPHSRSLVRFLRKNSASYDFCLFVGYRCGVTYYGAHAAASRAILVPRADADPAIGARIFRDIFRGARAILYDSPEERTLVQSVCAAQDVPSAVIGAGADVAQNPQPGRFRHKHNIRGPFAICVGRLDESTCGDLLPLFDRYSRERGSRLSLVLVGDGPFALPKHPKIRHVGSLDDAEKFDAMAAADVVIVPSRYQNFSRTAVEAWGLGKPVLANGTSKALSGQCMRSNGGLCYRGAAEFVGMLQALEQNRWLNASLGRTGRQYARDNFDWRVVGRKYHDMLIELQKRPRSVEMDPIPGWLARRRRDVPPLADAVRSVA